MKEYRGLCRIKCKVDKCIKDPVRKDVKADCINCEHGFFWIVDLEGKTKAEKEKKVEIKNEEKQEEVKEKKIKIRR